MKKYLFCYISLLMLISILMPCKVYAVDMSIGATTWYTWLEQEFSSNIDDYISSHTEQKDDSAFLYGPVLSVKFNDDFNLSFVYLFGKFDTEQTMGDNTLKYELKRRDSDLALNYRLNNYFKAFLGLKYIGFNISCQDKDKFSGGGPAGDVLNIKHNSLGPGLGLSATYPVYDNIFVLATISGFCLWGKESKDFNNNIYREKIKADYNDYGVNSTLSLAYYIAPAATTISLGGRFQYIKTYYRNFSNIDLGGGDVNPFDDGTTKFYGITLTATYSFGI